MNFIERKKLHKIFEHSLKTWSFLGHISDGWPKTRPKTQRTGKHELL